MSPRASAAELHLCLDVLRAIAEGCPSPAEFGRRGVEWLPRIAASEITTLSLCDLHTGRRRVVSDPPHAFDREALYAFDRHFFEHPLVRFHGEHRGAGAHRISDSLSIRAFRATPLYADYYAKVGLDHALALPLHVDSRWLVSFVFNRTGRDFSARDCQLLERIRPHLAATYAQSHALAEVQRALAEGVARTAEGAHDTYAVATLTTREREVLGWLAAGKTNAQIAAIIGASPRTVAKHLERIYEKLGVESRTAAALRALRCKGPGPLQRTAEVT